MPSPCPSYAVVVLVPSAPSPADPDSLPGPPTLISNPTPCLLLPEELDSITSALIPFDVGYLLCCGLMLQQSPTGLAPAPQGFHNNPEGSEKVSDISGQAAGLHLR